LLFHADDVSFGAGCADIDESHDNDDIGWSRLEAALRPQKE
jgi:hypothetical protein